MRNARLWDYLDQWQIGMFPTDPRAHIEIAQSLNTEERGKLRTMSDYYVK